MRTWAFLHILLFLFLLFPVVAGESYPFRVIPKKQSLDYNQSLPFGIGRYAAFDGGGKLGIGTPLEWSCFSRDFTVGPVNFERELWQCYKVFIEEVRRRVAVRFSHNRAVTPIEVNPPNRFFDVQLETLNRNIRVRFRRDNLYLIGYQMQGTIEWLELRFRDDPANIPGSAAVDIREQYDDLIKEANVGDLGQIHVGRVEFINAINVLATSTNKMTRARSLIVLVIMISEAVRFIMVSDHFGTTSRTRAPITNEIQNYSHAWQALSRSLLRTDGNHRFVLPDKNNIDEIQTFEDAVAKIGTIKGS